MVSYTIFFSLANVGFSCKGDWRGPGPARGVTNCFVGWKLLSGTTSFTVNPYFGLIFI